MEHLWEVPGVRAAGEGAAYFGGGLLLSGARVWGRMQPAALGLTLASRGWRCCAAALGSAVGYRLFWGGEGIQGMIWAAGAAVAALVLPMLDIRGQLRSMWAAMCIVSGTELAFRFRAGAAAEPALLLLRLLLGGCSALIAQEALTVRSRAAQWFCIGGCVLALGGVHPLLGAGAAGVLASAAPLPAAVLAGFCADCGGTGISLAAAAGISWFLLSFREPILRYLAPGAAASAVMLLRGEWDILTLLVFALGGAVGAANPWQPVPRHGSVGAAKVRLEQMAQVFTGFQRQLLEYIPAPPDTEALMQELRQNACGTCSNRGKCIDQAKLDTGVLTGDAPFLCRKSGLASAEIRRSRDTLRRIRAARVRQEEFRMALVQQYGLLADTLRGLSDELHSHPAPARYRVQVSARSRSRERADGDRVTAFPGMYARYYVLLCDGMGTGLGAAEESRTASEWIRRMLAAGIAPENVLGSVNSQLSLTDRGGAVTVDLAELRLDSGSAWVYKWGAAPCWLLRRGRALRIGQQSPPPGGGVSHGRENAAQASLTHGETLVMLSDGIRTDNASAWASCAANTTPGDLAGRILLSSASEDDDATAVVIRLVKREEGGRQ